MRRILKTLGIALLALTVVIGGGAFLLALTTPGPRPADTWERLGDMPDPRGETAAAVATIDGVGERLVVAGGIGGLGSSVDTVSIYDPDRGVWMPGPSLPEPRDHAAATALDATVYVTGGTPGAVRSEPASSLWELSPGAEEWRTLPPMPEARSGHRMVAHDGRLFVIGGDGPSARVLTFDPEDGWRTGPEMPEQRDHLGVVVTGDRIWAIGGRPGFGTLLDRVDIYDPTEGTWEPGPPLPEPMSAMSAGVVHGEIHVVGGEDPRVRGGVIDSHYRIAPQADEWAEAELPIVAVHGAPGAVLEERLVIAGGSRRQGLLSVLGWTGITQAYPAR